MVDGSQSSIGAGGNGWGSLGGKQGEATSERMSNGGNSAGGTMASRSDGRGYPNAGGDGEGETAGEVSGGGRMTGVRGGAQGFEGPWVEGKADASGRSGGTSQEPYGEAGDGRREGDGEFGRPGAGNVGGSGVGSSSSAGGQGGGADNLKKYWASKMISGLVKILDPEGSSEYLQKIKEMAALPASMQSQAAPGSAPMAGDNGREGTSAAGGAGHGEEGEASEAGNGAREAGEGEDGAGEAGEGTGEAGVSNAVSKDLVGEFGCCRRFLKGVCRNVSSRADGIHLRARSVSCWSMRLTTEFLLVSRSGETCRSPHRTCL